MAALWQHITAGGLGLIPVLLTLPAWGASLPLREVEKLQLALTDPVPGPQMPDLGI